MSNIILSGNQIRSIEAKIEELSTKPAAFRNSLEVFNSVLSNSQMTEWINGTSSASSVANELRKDIETFNLVITLINDIISETKNIASWNTQNNNKVVNDVALGNYGNGLARQVALTNAGYDYGYIQNKVNEQAGNPFRHPEDNV